MSLSFTVSKAPNESLTLSNCVICDESSIPPEVKHIEVSNNHDSITRIFTLKRAPGMPPNTLGFGSFQRQWAELSLSSQVILTKFDEAVDLEKIDPLGSVTLEVAFVSQTRSVDKVFDTQVIADALVQYSSFCYMTVGQPFVVDIWGVKLKLVVKSLESMEKKNLHRCLFHGKANINIQRAHNSKIELKGNNITRDAPKIINPTWNFNDMGIGGLDTEFSDIFRRAFASRVFPGDLVERLGIRHVRGLLLYGPPGL